MLVRNVLDLTTMAPVADLTAAREDVLDYAACAEITEADRETCLEHLDMLESAARILCALI